MTRTGVKAEHTDLYQCIVVAIRNTIRLMCEIDKAVPKWPME